jgi:hypothetical protein
METVQIKIENYRVSTCSIVELVAADGKLRKIKLYQNE